MKQHKNYGYQKNSLDSMKRDSSSCCQLLKLDRDHSLMHIYQKNDWPTILQIVLAIVCKFFTLGPPRTVVRNWLDLNISAFCFNNFLSQFITVYHSCTICTFLHFFHYLNICLQYFTASLI